MDSKEILVPIWVLKEKIEDDFEEFKQLSKHGVWEEDETFPVYDSTVACLEILKKEGITFNDKGEFIEP